MRLTGPTFRRRNARWFQVESRQPIRPRLEDEEDTGSEADDEGEPTPRFFRPAVQPSTAVSTGPNLGAGAGVTFKPNPGSGLDMPTGLPESTLAAGEGELEAEDEEEDEEEGVEEDEEDGEEESESDSDSDDQPSDGDVSSSDDESDHEEETTIPPPGLPATTTGLAAIAPPGTTSTITSGGTAFPTAGSAPALAPIGGIVGEPTGTIDGIMSQVQPTTTAGPSTTVPTSETTSVSSPSLGGADRVVTGTSEPTSLAGSAPVLSDGSGGGMESGAAAGIIIGVLAFVGILLIGGWFLFKKMRSRDPDSPPQPDPESDASFSFPKFSPPKIFNHFRASVDRSTYSWKFWDSNSSAGTRTTVAPAPALPPPQLPFANKKTNSEMVDDLMRAAYAAESGGNYNDLESRAGYWDEKSQAGAPAQVNEKTYKALFGNGPNSPMPPTAPTMPFVGKPNNQGRPLTNGGNPMKRWLDATATPRQT
ncbi:hypothetical protein V8F33_003261 [Rhypophila sp. PSN 637]